MPQQSSKVKPTRICDINWTASKLNKGEDGILASINSLVALKMNSHLHLRGQPPNTEKCILFVELIGISKRL